MTIETTLDKLGFSDKEIAIYTSCLQLGPASMTEISNKAAIKRPTAYLIVESLIKRGLVSIVRKQHKTLYAVERPKKILTILRQQERALEHTLPELEALYNSPKHKPKIRIYEGIEGVRTVYDEIYASLSRKEEVLFITNVDDLVKYAPFTVEYFVSKLAKVKKFKIRELNTGNQAGLQHYHSTKNKRGPDHYVKNTTTKFPFSNDTVLYGNSVVFFALKKDIFVTIIENEEINSTMRSLFEVAWAGYEPKNVLPQYRESPESS